MPAVVSAEPRLVVGDARDVPARQEEAVADRVRVRVRRDLPSRCLDLGQGRLIRQHGEAAAWAEDSASVRALGVDVDDERCPTGTVAGPGDRVDDEGDATG